MREIKSQDLAVILKAVSDLAAIRQAGTTHLCVENFATELLDRLLVILGYKEK